MKIQFISDYIGRETAMKQYRKGDVDVFPVAQALELIRLGVADEIKDKSWRDVNIINDKDGYRIEPMNEEGDE
jgi:hypothetical protein